MMLSAGAKLGPYEIVSPLGAGGMGEVYRALDTRLDRTIALKLLPSEPRDRPERKQRFLAEARAISSLNHPHICTLFDVGEHEGVAFFVMEYLEGETLDDRLTRGPLPAQELLLYASQIADALDHAHRERLVHRDLKPSNVMLTASGAKLLDFGLARGPVVDVTPIGSTVSLPAERLTAEGSIVGTLNYMAPEQLEGKDADSRTDIFAFGTLLYEMATGRKAFEGASQASLIASILKEDPPAISSAQSKQGVSSALEHVIRRCHAKNPDERWQSARDVLFELRWIAGHSVPTSHVVIRGRRLPRIAWVAAAVAFVAVAAVTLRHQLTAPSAGTPVQLEVSLPEGTIIPSLDIRTSIALSPDGRHLAFVALRDGRSQVWLRSLDSLATRALPGTEDARVVFWSPDSRYLGFVASGRLQRMDTTGGPPQFICQARVETVPTWGRGDTILFDQIYAGGSGIFRVPANGGAVTQITAVDEASKEREHFWPRFLPDGVHFFYLVSTLEPDTGAFTHAVYMSSLDAPGRVRVADEESRMEYAAPGHVLYARDGGLMARAFDVSGSRFTSDPIRIAERLSYFKGTGLAEFTASENGSLAFRDRTGVSELVWFDRAGKPQQTLGARASYDTIRLSPDGRRIAVQVTDPRTGLGNLWLYDRATGIPTQFTSDPLESIRPVWSADNVQLFFRSARGGSPDVYQKRADGRGLKEPVIELEGVQNPEDASLDGRHLVYAEGSRATASDLWVLPLTDRKPKPYLTTNAIEGSARFSPDGRWLAFTTTETGSPEIYVAPIEDSGAKIRVSAAGGIGPRWRRDGKELFYFTLDNTLMAVPIAVGADVLHGVAHPLFTVDVFKRSGGNLLEPAYDVSEDGQRFLINRMVKDGLRAPITVVLNWPGLLRH
jgi:eukaryotic-like serine/threonine-protein kinase